MKAVSTFPIVLVVAASIISLPGCGKPQSEVDKLVDKLIQKDIPGWAPINYSVVPELNKYGAEALDALLNAIETCPKYAQPSYSTVITLMQAGTARYEACKKLLNHPNSEVRKDAVEGMAADGSPDEGVMKCIKLSIEHEEPSLRSVAIYALSCRKSRKFEKEICKTLRRATTDPVQDVREHAQRGLVRFGCQ